VKPIKRRQVSTVQCLQPQDFTVIAPVSGSVDCKCVYFDFRDLEGKVMRRFGLSAGDRVEVTFRKVNK
jgi:hypothetical protein